MIGGVCNWTAIASGVLMVALSAWVIAKPMEKHHGHYSNSLAHI